MIRVWFRTVVICGDDKYSQERVHMSALGFKTANIQPKTYIDGKVTGDKVAASH